jgi:predicted short-subunit dehydrogenase-like oxidoreductase (DUF2520 family)
MNNKIGIIGFGNVGRTLKKNLDKSFKITVKKKGDPYTKLSDSSIIIICVKDREIEGVVNEIFEANLKCKGIFHTSGCINSRILAKIKCKAMGSIHFPMSINAKIKIPELYQKIGVFEGNSEGKKIIRSIFKKIGLEIYEIQSKEKEFYHYTCSLVGNIPFMIISEAKKHLKKLELPDTIIFQLLESGWENFKAAGKDGLTGPLVRRDHDVIKRHIENIKDKEEKKLYKTIIEYFKNRYEK